MLRGLKLLLYKISHLKLVQLEAGNHQDFTKLLIKHLAEGVTTNAKI
jgi:hypothetical protein